MRPPRTKAGFTLLEVMIAMSVLVIGATSILGIYVAAVGWQSARVDLNRITQLHNHALRHAQIEWDAFDPRKAQEEGRPAVPKKIEADLRDKEAARRTGDPMIIDAADKYVGYQYTIVFDTNEYGAPGSSVVADIRITRRNGEEIVLPPAVLTRKRPPWREYLSPKKEEKQ